MNNSTKKPLVIDSLIDRLIDDTSAQFSETNLSQGHSFYNDELIKMRHLVAEFSRKHPTIAGNLQSDNKQVEDPHIEQLIEAFALLTARIKQKLTDDFSEMSEALLNHLYPDYLSPIPSMSVVQFQFDPAKLQTSESIPRHSLIASDLVDGHPCYFRTAYPVTLYPILIKQATLTPISNALANWVDKRIDAEKVTAVLRLTLSCANTTFSLNDLAPERLRFFINAIPQMAYELYELLFQSTESIVLAYGADDSNPIFINKSCLQPVGFDKEEEMFPMKQQGLLGYRLLTEFFIFPEKFLFFDIVGFKDKIGQKCLLPGQDIDLCILLKQTSPTLERDLTLAYFALGCTPIINLFPKLAEAIPLMQTHYEYRVIPDTQQPSSAIEIYCIEDVLVTDKQGKSYQCCPFYGNNYHSEYPSIIYWLPMRRQIEQGQDKSTNVFLTFSGPDFEVLEDPLAHIDILCTNRNLPRHLPFGKDHPQYRLCQHFNSIKRIECLTPMTATHHINLDKKNDWALFSHLSLNHLTLVDNREGILALRTALQLYHLGDEKEIQNLLCGLLNMRSKKVYHSAKDLNNTVLNGFEITIDVDETKFSSNSLFLFSSILERFFALYTPINTFTQLVIESKQTGKLYDWAPRSGIFMIF